MRIIKPTFVYNDNYNGKDLLKKIEKAGRICYKSEDKISEESAVNFITMIIQSGHESVLEHEKITVTITCDRGVSHEIVRHRIASYSQESTRYCNYANDKFGHELTFIKPCYWDENDPKFTIWKTQMEEVEEKYFMLIESGAKPQEARAILPNSLKTEIVVTMNIREWRHFFRLRCSEAAHPQMREIAQMILTSFRNDFPILFDSL